MTIGALVKYLARSFSDPREPELVLISDSGVAWIDEADNPQFFPCGSSSCDIEEALNSVFREIAKSAGSYSKRCIVSVGGSYSVSVASKAKDSVSLDLTIKSSNQPKQSVFSVSTLTAIPETIIESAIDSELIDLLERITTQHQVTLVGLCTISELSLNCLRSQLVQEECVYLSWPIEGVLIRHRNGCIEIVRDSASTFDEAETNSGLSELASQQIPYSKLTISPKELARSCAGWTNRLDLIRTRERQWSIDRITPRVTRVAVALILTLGALGLWQSEALSDSHRRDARHERLLQARTELKSQHQSLLASSGAREIIPGLTLTSFLGRLGQGRVDGVRLTHSQINSIDGAAEVMVTGVAQNESQVFHYIESLEEYFPRITIALENLSMRHSTSRKVKTTSTSFELRFTR